MSQIQLSLTKIQYDKNCPPKDARNFQQFQFIQDSDQESIETNDSNNDNKIAKFSNQKVPEIDVQPKRKIFFSAEEKIKYVEEYQKKYKTEVCKNWKIKGTCVYGNKCCFAHGEQELQSKRHLKQAYKTKPCKKYFIQGFCPYGYRCQYIHSDIKYYPQFYSYLENVFQFKNLPLSQINFAGDNYYSTLLQQICDNPEMPIHIACRLKIFEIQEKDSEKDYYPNNF